MDKVKISKSTRAGKKLMAIFSNKDGKKKTIHFGSEGMSDFTKHKDPARKKRYEDRHRKREDWPLTAGALSKWVLWPTLRGSIKDFKQRFNLK